MTQFRVLVRAPRGKIAAASTPLKFVLHLEGAQETATYDTVFMGPSR